ncbi:MAG: hypothetical protein ABIJ09_23565 [Pseudomonadota bacterium]
MVSKPRPTFAKRQKEIDRQRKKAEKAEARAQRRENKGVERVADGEDPDLAGIVPGPQPIPED